MKARMGAIPDPHFPRTRSVPSGAFPRGAWGRRCRPSAGYPQRERECWAICVSAANIADSFDFDESSDQQSSDIFSVCRSAAEGPWTDTPDRRMRR